MVVLNLDIGIRIIFLRVVFAQVLIKNCAVAFCVSKVLCAALVRPEVRVKQMYVSYFFRD